MPHRSARCVVVVFMLATFSGWGLPLSARAATPTSVTLVGNVQNELGCGGDWDPSCTATHLTVDVTDGIFQKTFTVPAGSWEYKAAINDSFDENYGLHAVPDGANIPLNLSTTTAIKFYYDPVSHWITDNQNSIIATAAGNFQSELGCSGDWQPDCLRSWLQDPDGDGIYTFDTTVLPPGDYETKVMINEAFDENYGQGGAPGGSNITFTVPAGGAPVRFSYDASTHILTIGYPATVTLDLNVTPNAPVDVSFSGDLGNFSLDDDSGDATLASSASFYPTAGVYHEAVALPSGWSFGSSPCSNTGAGAVSFDADTGTLELHLASGDEVSCTIALIDDSGPSISVLSPVESAPYLVGSTVVAGYSCADAGSGPDTCIGNVASGSPIDTSSVGARSFTVSAVDRAGNPAQVTVQYTVAHKFAWLTSENTLKHARAGDPLYFKFSLGINAGNAIVQNGYPKMQPVSCGNGAALGPSMPLATLSGIQYLAGPRYYQFIWNTDRGWAGSCYQVHLMLTDGLDRTLTVKFAAQPRR